MIDIAKGCDSAPLAIAERIFFRIFKLRKITNFMITNIVEQKMKKKRWLGRWKHFNINENDYK